MTSSKIVSLSLVAVLLLGLVAFIDTQAHAKADKILTNGKIYTMSDDFALADSVAIKNGKIAAVGTWKDLKRWEGDETKVINLDGRTAVPGLVDAHSHLVYGGTARDYECNFTPALTEEQLIDYLKQCIADQPDVAWLTGGGWTEAYISQFNIDKNWLDTYVSADLPIALTDITKHARLLNSKALAMAGITADLVIPSGEIVLENGEPNGILREAASGYINLVLPGYTQEQVNDSLKSLLDDATKYGITAIKEAGDFSQGLGLRAYLTLEGESKLNHHISFSIVLLSNDLDMPLLMSMKGYKSELVNPDTIKIILDGVPGAKTAAMLENYISQAHNGALNTTPKKLNENIDTLVKAGFGIKIHAAGDRSLRVALDAIEYARENNKGTNSLFEIAHASLISTQDFPRFKELDVMAELSPYVWYPSPFMTEMEQTIGKERISKMFPIKDLLDAGVRMSAGSDMPAVSPMINPWLGVESMVSRMDPTGKNKRQFAPEQSITIKDAMRIFTKSGAEALNLADKIGSIELNKNADIVILNQNIFEIPTEQISETLADMVIFNGKVVFKK